MRFLVTVDRDWVTTVTTSDAAGWEARPRPMRRLDLGPAGQFPAPPEDELPDQAAEHHLLCSGTDPDALASAYRSITMRERQAPISLFGRYLFESLLGETRWREMLAAAAARGERTVELALCWPPGELALHRLNWEMMRSATAFLAAGAGPARVAITRLVAGATASERVLDAPPRVLFVVGSSLTDPKIRPGAEYLGLLRRLKREGRMIHARLLEHATPSAIQQAVAAFKPEIVHFICHGAVDTGSGQGYLELTVEEKGADPRRSGEDLRTLLRGDDGWPAIVVLSACFSGGPGGARMLGAHETAPLAAQLVGAGEDGIPVVLGMSGRVSDLACRLFTRRFGECLVRGDSLVAATADARRATLIEGNPPHWSPDWALPAVFLSEAVKPDYAPVRPSDNDQARVVANMVTDYRVDRGPVFCGRETFLQAYDRMARDEEPRVLAVFTRRAEPGFGRTRLLEELVIQALCDGNIPVLVRRTATVALPTTLQELAGALLREIGAAREALGLEPAFDAQVLLLLRETDEGRRSRMLDKRILWELSSQREITTAAIRRALQLDLASLAVDARRAHQRIAERNGRVVVLLDDVDAYDAAVAPLFEELLGRAGLGTAEEPVPVIMTLSFSDPLGDYFRKLVETAPSRSWLAVEELEPFREDGEDMMAYELVLLTSSFNPEAGRPSWVRNPDVADSVRGLWEGNFRRWLKGMPIELTGERFDMLTELGAQAEFLMEADDEDRLARLLEDG
jgi:hypothetical protein